jgi:serine/alanine racemase
MKISTKALSLSENRTKHYNCIDLIKFICALFVVSIHVSPFASYNSFINYGLKNYIARIAVPFFFVASGYFLFRKTSYERFDKKIALTYVRRIFRIYVIWTIIYFPWVLKNSILVDEIGIRHGFLNWMKHFFLTGSFSHLWYLNATIIATLILIFCISKKIRIKTIMCIATVLYVVGLIPQTYSILLNPLCNIKVVWMFLDGLQRTIETTRNGLFFGFLFMGIGMVFAYKPIVMKYRTAVVGFGVSMMLFLIEAFAVNELGWARENDMYICLVPVVFFLFYIVSHIEIKDNLIYTHLRKLGSLIFYLHLFIYYSMENILSYIGINNSLIYYGIIVLITIIVSECIILLSTKFKWLKIVYS